MERTAQPLSLILVPICCYVREGRIMVRIAVVEDEAVSRQLLANYLARYSEENGVSFEVTYFEERRRDHRRLQVGVRHHPHGHPDDSRGWHDRGARDPRGRSGGRPRIHHVRRAVRDPRLPGGCTLLPHEAAALVRVLAGTIQVSRGRGRRRPRFSCSRARRPTASTSPISSTSNPSSTASTSTRSPVRIRSPRRSRPWRISSPVTTSFGQTPATSSISPTCAASPTRSAS